MSRKEKSLGLLCHRFLNLYKEFESKQNQQVIICLDEMAKILNVERRRIYDIVNVLESVEVLSRVCKNQYQWHGFANISHTLSKLKTLAVKSNFLEYTKALMLSQLESAMDLNDDHKQAANIYNEQREISSFQIKKTVESKDASTQTINISREEKSLGIMAQKFLMLFLTAEDGLVSINFAARVLLGDTKNDTTELGRFKTKIRRLYDIANVFSSVNLIEKYLCNNVSISKPAYKYIGPEVNILREAEYVSNFTNTENPASNSKHSLFDHFKRNLSSECNIPKFDINTGILTSKELVWKRRSDTNLDSKVKREKFDTKENEIQEDENCKFDTYHSMTVYYDQNTNENQQPNQFDVEQHLHNQQPQYDNFSIDHCMFNNEAHHLSTYNNYYHNTLNEYTYSTEQLILDNQFSTSISDNIINNNDNQNDYTNNDSSLYHQISSAIQSNWNDDTQLVDSICPAINSYLPSFSTFFK